MGNPSLGLPVVNRLDFVRLLYQQGIEQSRQPDLLAAASILTFHDTVEQFLILVTEHRRASSVSRDGGIMQYWNVLKPRRGFDTGVELSGQHGISRLNSVRNDLKHGGQLPRSEAIADARSAVTSFLEDNTPKVFGLEFGAIDLADVVPQEEVRAKLKSAAAAEAAGDRKDAMAWLAETFTGLLSDRVGWGSAYKFGNTLRQDPWDIAGPMVSALAKQGVLPQDRRAAQASASKLDRQLKQLVEASLSMQRGLRVIALGIDYGRYNRFELLTPHVSGSGEHRHVHASADYTPSREEYDDCVQFVIAVALRLPELDAQTAPRSWRRAI